jgi:hypothetical protein
VSNPQLRNVARQYETGRYTIETATTISHAIAAA